MAKKITTGSVVALIMGIIMLTVLLSVAQNTIPTGAQAFYDLSASFTNTTVYGSGAVNLAADLPSYVGWFWVVGPFVLVIGLVVGLFMKRGRR